MIYKINCKDCDKVYIGQTSRALRSRTREHKRAIFTGDKNSLLAQHCKNHNHDFDLDDVKIIERCSQWSKRLFLEAWHLIPLMNTFTFLTFTRPLAIPSDVSATLLKLSFAFVSHFIAEEGYSILTETSTQSFLVSDNTFFISYYFNIFTSKTI